MSIPTRANSAKHAWDTGEQAEQFYRELSKRIVTVRVGMEASGHARWFERLLIELQFELWTDLGALDMPWRGKDNQNVPPGQPAVPSRSPDPKEMVMTSLLVRLWSNDGQDIAEYAVMLAVILVIVVGTIRLIGSNANTVFSQAASSIQ